MTSSITWSLTIGTEISHETISNVTDAVADEVTRLAVTAAGGVRIR